MTDTGRARGVALLVGLCAFAASLTNLRPMGSGDTIGARLLPFSLLREGNLDLDEFAWLHPAPGGGRYFLLRDADGHWRSKYPVATPLVATPVAWPFLRWADAQGIADQDARFRLLTAVFERLAAALLGAVSVALVLLAARAIASLRWAIAATVVYAFGTGTWVYSQALWQHPLAEVGIAGAAICLLRPPTRRRALLAGAAAALALAARPPAIIPAAIFGLCVWRERRADLWHFLGTFTAGTALLVAYNVSTLAWPTGGYHGGGLGPPDGARLLGLLVSPSRGLFVYCPLALLALGALSRRTRPTALRWFALAMPAYALFFAGSRLWWGGYSYGPRLFTDVMPLVVLCALPLAQRLCRYHAGRALLVAGAAWGIGVQAIGVYCDDNDWNNFPVSVDRQPGRLWSWSDAQIPRALRGGTHATDFAPLLRQLFTDSRPAPLVILQPADLAGAIEALTATPWRCRAGTACAVDVRVANHSASTVWPAYSDFGDLEVALGAFWRADGAIVPDVGGVIPLLRQLGPGDAARVRLPLDPPPRPGTYELELVVIQSFGRTAQHGGASLTVPVIVE